MSKTIKLNHAAVMKQLEQVSSTLQAVSLKSPSAVALGRNNLDFTKKWLEREAEICNMVEQYKEAVRKNIEDTRSNVDTLKEQDEAIARR
ncbi:YwqI/YxiC family protein [Bacillus paralicheniformis]|uniref:YwqI/YxiC family protein n=1 Tax=Bacillus TaxID=1386 RepID=UPI001C24253E|nr:YwqI/YxiC family protein [Bacillus paralicheniformis]MBU8580385.1 YwqI/YxiC family protein [Bacillus paralicheniformis]MCY8038854.1 YwqI/YxiC family protein [Bacillus paralicheniformis]